jgi:predicted deacetylase
MNKNLKIILAIVTGCVLLCVSIILVCRLILHEELDDVHPYILDVNDPLAQRSKWLWVIPVYMNEPISNHPQWVKDIKDSGKKIGLHGVYHTKKEFRTDRSDEYIDKGIREFTKAFGYYPTHFKAPGLALTASNRKKIEERGIIIKGLFNQLTHRVHHSPKGRRTNGLLIGE